MNEPQQRPTFDLQNGLGDGNHFLQVPPLLPKSRGDGPRGESRDGSREKRTNELTDVAEEPEVPIRVSTISGEFKIYQRLSV